MIVAVVGISFAAFTYTQAGERENIISTGTITMTYTEGQNGINIENAIPMTEDQGKVLKDDKETFDFTVSATITGKTVINYDVVAVKDSSSTIDDKYIRLYLEKGEVSGNYDSNVVFGPSPFEATTEPKYGAEGETMKLTSGTFDNMSNGGARNEFNAYYRLRMWVDQSYELTGESKTYSVKVNVYGKGQD